MKSIPFITSCDLISLLITVYNTCRILLNNEKYVDANLEAPDNAVAGNEPSPEMLSSQKLE